MSLADRYRPSDFSEVVGQEEVVRSISKLLMQDEHPRTYLFHGPAGCGKTSIARIMKKKLECADAEYNEMNVANTRGIETIRDVIQKAKFSPFFGKVRLFIFDECHKITIDAQNALLKILEEPPAGHYFILCTTDIGKIIPTVVNRCTIYNLAPLAIPDLLELINKVVKSEKIELTDMVVRMIARASNGSARTSMIITESVISDIEHAEEIINGYKSSDAKVIDLCRLFIKPGIGWNDIRFVLKPLLKEGDDLESYRSAIINYMGAVILSEAPTAVIEQAAYVCSLFNFAFQSNEKGLFIHRCYEAARPPYKKEEA